MHVSYIVIYIYKFVYNFTYSFTYNIVLQTPKAFSESNVLVCF